MRHGWFDIPGVQSGDRTLAEQATGLDIALSEAAGKSVLDLGCAEGLISLEFLKAGANIVVGIDHSKDKIEMAKRMCYRMGKSQFITADLGVYFPEQAKGKEGLPLYDIVLALSIITKLPDPAVPLRYAARSCLNLLLLRTSAALCDGTFYAKHGGKSCNVIKVLEAEGFKSEAKFPSSHGEAIEYWRRK